MKHFCFLSKLLFCLIFYSCNPPTPIYQLKEMPAVASCGYYQIVDADDEPIDLPEHILEALDCATTIDLTDGVLTYIDGEAVKLYRIKDKVDAKMFTLHEGMDGISNPVWSEDRTQIMLVIINQNKTHGYKEFARIISLDLDKNLQVKSKLKFDRPVNFVCGSTCNSEPYEDFKYIDKGIKFKRNTNIEERPGVYEIVLLEE